MAKTITLTDKNDKKTGGSADEKILAKGGNDSVGGGAGRDTLDGGSGNDQLTGGADNDTLLGGDGSDTAVYAGALEDRNGERLYAFELNADGQLRVIDLGNKEGVDTLDSIEFLKFKDGTVAVADIIKEINNAVPQLSIDPASQSINEGTGSEPTEVTLNLQLSEPSDQPVSVHVATVEGTASRGSDYTPLDQVVTFAPGETDQSVTVLIAADAVKEGSEQFTVKLDNPKGLEIDGNGVATIGIVDDDAGGSSGQVGIQTSDVKIAEGNAGSKTVTVTVSLTGSSPNKVSVDYTTLDGSAVAGSDYQSKSGTLTFNPGETQKTINITVNGDTQAEGDETFSLSLSNPQGAKINTPKATITLSEDDSGVQTSTNHAPLAKDDSFTGLPAGQQVVKTGADLLKNDVDPDGDALTVTQVGDAVGGIVSLKSNGQILFTPNEGAQSGGYSYTVNDGHGAAATANVTLGFLAPDNHAPQAQDDSFTGLPGNQAASQTAASLLKNDSDPDGDTLAVSAVGNAQNGTVSLTGDSVTFTPQTGQASGSYQYSVSDGHGGSASATVKLGFVLPNQAPNAVDDSLTGKPANQPLTIAPADLLKNDSDPDKNPLTLSAVSNAQNDTVELKNGQVVFTPAQDATSGSFQYQVEDGQGGSDTAMVSLGFVLPAAPSVSSSLPADTRNYDFTLPLDDSDNSLDGSPLNEKILGLGGKDKLNGKAGNDYLDGGDGDDSLWGDVGNDYLLGGAGNDSIWGGADNDSIDGGEGGNQLYGEDGNDLIVAGSDSDKLDGGNGDDQLSAGSGNNQLYGQAGNDTIQGNDGNDTIDAGNGNNSVDGGNGDDKITVGNGNDSVIGHYGQDSISGGAGDDRLFGDFDKSDGDYFSSSSVSPTSYGNDVLHGNEGDDYLEDQRYNTALNAGTQQLYGDEGNDTVVGYGELYGGTGNDTLRGIGYLDGGEGDDTLIGEATTVKTTFNGGTGRDTITASKAVDVIRYSAASDSGAGVDQRDIVKDFDISSSDVIDLSRLSSSPLSFSATSPYSGTAGEVRFDVDVAGNRTIIGIDLDGNRVSDMEIELTGIKLLAADDFLLTPPAP